MVTGIVGSTLRVTNSFNSSSRNSFERIFGVMPSNARWISLKRFGPFERATISVNFHLPFQTYKASLTAVTLALHVSGVCVGLSKCVAISLVNYPKGYHYPLG